jgi:hypothetical protein
MPATTEDTSFVEETQQQLLQAIEQAQDASIRFASLLAERSPKLPTPAQAVESGFAFAGRMLELQRRYALGLVGVVETPKPAKQAG